VESDASPGGRRLAPLSRRVTSATIVFIKK